MHDLPKINMTKIATCALVLLLFTRFSVSWSMDKAYRDRLSKNLGEITQNFLNQHDIIGSERLKFSFPNYTKQQLDDYLKAEFGGLYDGYNVLIEEYVKFWMARPQAQLQLWYTMDQQFLNEIGGLKGKPVQLVVHQLLRSRLNYPKYHDNANVLLPYVLSLVYGNEKDAYHDKRWDSSLNFSLHFDYLVALNKRFGRSSHAMAALVLGAATVSRASDGENLGYWSMYESLEHEDRDFYPSLLASSFVFHWMEQGGMKSLQIRPKDQWLQTQSDFPMHLSVFRELDKNKFSAVSLRNQVYYQKVITPGSIFLLPQSVQEQLKAREPEFALRSAYVIHNIKSPNCLVYYRLKQAENHQDVAKNFNCSLADLEKINFLNPQYKNARTLLFVPVNQKDSLFYAAFDSMSAQGIQEQLKLKITVPDVKQDAVDAPKPDLPASKKIYVVKSGDTLSGISRKHGVSVAQLKSWNNLKSDNIQIGQKLIVKK